jgi:uncharacterized protein (TIGR04255 family)
MPQYKRPPITEAVIEIRLEQELSRDVVDKLNVRFGADYPFSTRFGAVGVNLDLLGRQAIFDEQASGYKLTSSDQTDILLVAATHFSCSRLAPYNGWEAFRARAQSEWKICKKITGYRKIQRLGVRYINRIDIPNGVEDKIKPEIYFRVYPETPNMDVMPAIAGFTMQLIGTPGPDNCKLVINSGLVPSPLVGHTSVLLDLDLSLDRDVPQKEGELWDRIEAMRVYKNNAFEACITDSTRELFDR